MVDMQARCSSVHTRRRAVRGRAKPPRRLRWIVSGVLLAALLGFAGLRATKAYAIASSWVLVAGGSDSAAGWISVAAVCRGTASAVVSGLRASGVVDREVLGYYETTVSEHCPAQLRAALAGEGLSFSDVLAKALLAGHAEGDTFVVDLLDGRNDLAFVMRWSGTHYQVVRMPPVEEAVAATLTRALGSSRPARRP